MKNYDKITERIKELATDPSILAAHIENSVGGIQHTMPNISQSLGNHIVKSVNYLHSKIPKPTGVLPLMSKWEPSIPQIDKFEKHYNAVNDPTDALHQISKGELSGETMEALKTIHPQLLEEMQQKLKSHIQPNVAEKLPNHIKRGLSMFFGTPLESQDMPSVKMSNQSILQAQQQVKQAQEQMGGKTTQKGLSELSVSKRSATETTKDEESKA